MGDELEIKESQLKLSGFQQTQMKRMWGENGFVEYYEKIKQAVEETAGLVIMWGDSKPELIQPLFHHVSAGRTRDGGEAYPYLRPVDSLVDLEAEEYLTLLKWSPEEMAACLEPETIVAGEQISTTMQLISREESGYVTEYQIGSHTFTGEKLKELLGLPSTAFTLSMHEGNIRATCKGSGHGYGLSQYGAHRMAQEGMTAEEILQYYYRDVFICAG